MSNLTLHFTWGEAARSATADRLGIDNTIPPDLHANVRAVAEAMETVRALLGGHSLGVNSWYRCPALNRAVGGSSRSRHMQGLAVDFDVTQGTNAAAFETLATSGLPFDQLIHEGTKDGADWIHYGLSVGTPRRQVLTAHGAVLGGPMAFRVRRRSDLG